MAGKYHSYSEYKDSGVEWLGGIPSDWNISRIKYVASIYGRIGFRGYTVDDIVDEGDGALVLSPSNIDADGFTLDKKTYLSWEKYYESPEIMVDVGDILLVKTGSTFGKSTIVKEVFEPMTINPQMALLKRSKIDARFLAYLLNSDLIRAKIDINNTGSGMPTMTQENINGFPVPFPEKNLAVQIANFLDHETAKIDTLIERQQQLIKLLQEKRQAVISHAVTKGLNPDAPMRDSGVEWLGEVPEHWEITYLNHLVDEKRRIMYGIVLPGPDVDDGVPIVKGGDVKPGRLTLDSLCKTTRAIEAGYVRSRLIEGDLVYSIRGTIGDVELVPKEIEGANLTQDAARIAPKKGIYNIWLKYVMESTGVFSQLEIGSLGAAVRGINIRDLKKAVIPCPPEPEMRAIANYIDRMLEKINRLSDQCDAQVQLLRERRTALISAAVTGKIDVRDWQAPVAAENTEAAA